MKWFKSKLAKTEKTALSYPFEAMFLSDEEVIDFLDYFHGQPEIAMALPMQKYERHEMFKDLTDFAQQQCCLYHFGIQMFLSGFRVAEMYFNRKKELEELAKIK